jgi:hypothetical protein
VGKLSHEFVLLRYLPVASAVTRVPNGRGGVFNLIRNVGSVSSRSSMKPECTSGGVYGGQ